MADEREKSTEEKEGNREKKKTSLLFFSLASRRLILRFAILSICDLCLRSKFNSKKKKRESKTKSVYRRY